MLVRRRGASGRPRTAVAAAFVATALALAGCGTSAPTTGPEPSRTAPPAPPATGGAPGSSASGAPSTHASLPPSAPAERTSPPPIDGDSASLLRICFPGPPEPSDIDCQDAVDTALGVARASPPPFRAVLTWSAFCAFETPCPSHAQDPNSAYVVLYLPDGTGVAVDVRLENATLIGGPPIAISARDIGPRQTFAAPSVATADVGAAPAVIANRPAMPLCGTERAGLAGPFDAGARNCFMTALLAGSPAEFASRRADVGGAPFLELWRFGGSGPVTVYREESGGWSELRCGIVIVAGDQVFDHTDCTSAPVR